MELPQPRPFGTPGRMSTHDFLSLYSPVQDPRPSQGNYLKTQDFLQPLEEKNSGKEENTVEITAAEKAPPPSPRPPSVEHLILPGGIGTYSTSQISYFHQRVPKPEGDDCSSYAGSGFTLWEESAVKKGKTGKENNNNAGDTHVTRESGMKIGRGGQWMTLERPSGPSQSSSNNNHHCNTTTTFSSLSSSQPSSSQKNQSFMDMIKSANVANDEDDDDEEEFVFKKELSPHLKSDLTVKVMDGKSTDQKPNTPRSKHSATEQRRRSKINDRFQMLREFIPHSDQKRDKASFLLEVIEYIQYLQEKVHKHEGSYQGWNQEPELMPWRNNHKPDPGFVDQSRATNSGSDPALMFAAKYEENNINVSSTNPMNGQNAVEYKMSSVATLKAIDHHSGLTNMAVPHVPLQPNIFTPGGSCSAIAPVPARMVSDTENVTSQPQSQFWQSRSCTADCAVASKNLKEQKMSIESGTINISTVYSQGLLNTLTQALQSSGVDLSQASISVQIELGKPLDSRPTTSMSAVKDNEIPSRNPVMAHSRGASDGEESDRAPKRLKTRV